MAINLSWAVIGNYVLLGLLCGIVGVSLTRLMYFTEERFRKLRGPEIVKPAIGGAMQRGGG